MVLNHPESRRFPRILSQQTVICADQAKLAAFKASTGPEPFVENSHAAGRRKTITNDDRNGLSTRESLVLGGQR
jgi:hypothetical protein